MPLDYSKWKDIEVSDDEDDTHPNVDTPSLFRWRHQARMERMAEQKKEQEELELSKNDVNRKLKDLENRLKESSLEESIKTKLQKEYDQIKAEDKKFRDKEEELRKKMEHQPWNVDTIGHEAWSKSRINKVDEKKAVESAVDPDEESKLMMAFFTKHRKQIEAYSRLHGFEASREYLTEHPHLCCEWTANHLTIDALNAAMQEKETLVDTIAHQTVTLQFELELAKSLKAKPDATSLIEGFFRKIMAAEETYIKMYKQEVQAFKERIFKRAKEKLQEALAEQRQEEAEEKQKRMAEAPGGLDPIEVMESLPKEMQDCFEAQDIEGLKALAGTMDAQVFSYHLKRCIDSGLWVPEANKGADDD